MLHVGRYLLALALFGLVLTLANISYHRWDLRVRTDVDSVARTPDWNDGLVIFSAIFVGSTAGFVALPLGMAVTIWYWLLIAAFAALGGGLAYIVLLYFVKKHNRITHASRVQ